MDFIRTVVNSNILNTVINIPESLKGRMVEVLILPIDELKEEDNLRSLKGSLSKYKNVSLIEQEAHVWDLVKENNENG